MLPLTMIVLPKNSGFQIGEMSVSGMYGPVDAVEERAGVRVEERAVGVEGTVLDGDRDLVVGLVGRELVVRLGRRARQHRRRADAAVEHGIVARGPPRMMKKPAGPAYTFRRVMPSVWSWYQSVEARWLFGYWKTARARLPGAAPEAFVAALLSK